MRILALIRCLLRPTQPRIEADVKKRQTIDIRDIDGRKARSERLRWGLDIPTVAGRADIGMSALGKFERGQLRKVPLIWRVNLARALRQLVYERAQEMVGLLGPAIAADPDAGDFTREAARKRRREQYGHAIPKALTEDADV